MRIILILILAAALAGGVAAASQNAKPGSAFYGIKLGVVEPVKEAFASGDEAKARLEADLADERIDEAEGVAANGTLSADVRLQIEQNFSAHADRMRELTVRLADTDARVAADLAANFETSLQAHDKILAQIASDSDKPEQDEVKDVDGLVNGEEQTIEDLDNDLEAKVAGMNAPDVRAAAVGRMTAAQNKIDEVRKFIDLKKGQLGADAAAQADARLAIAQAAFADAKAKLDAGDNAGAFIRFGDALSIAQEAKLLMTARLEGKGEVDIDGDEAEMENDVEGIESEVESEEAKPETDENVNANVNAGGENENRSNVNAKVNVNVR